MKKIVILLLLVVLQHAVAGQDYKQELARMQEGLNKIDKLHIEAEVKMFMSDAASRPLTVKRSVVKKNGNEYYCSLDNTTILINSKCMLMVYGDEKQIVYTESNQKKEIEKRVMDPADINKLLEKNDSVSYKGESNGVKHYTVHSSKGMIRTSDIYIDTSTGFLKKVIYRYDPKAASQVEKIEIEYSRFDTSPQFGNNDFSEKKFVTRSGKELKGYGSYAGYNILNYDPEKF